jgi:uncharacterized protein YfaS (alpha-2-macroglobulin family)
MIPAAPSMRRKFQQILSLLFGEFSWQPPRWLRRSASASLAWVRWHPRTTFALLLWINILGFGGWRVLDWYRHRPTPETVSVSVLSPGVTPLGKELIPRPIVIEFGASVAKIDEKFLKSLGISSAVREHARIPSPEGIRIDPPVEGKWVWGGERQLVFHPRDDWPADRTYHIKLARSLFASHVLLERYEVEAKTPPFTATMSKIEFYTDPTDPAVKQVVATFDFTHRVDLTELEKRINLGVIGDSSIFKKGAPRFTLTAGQHQRMAYLRTSPLILPEHEDFLRVTLEKGLPTLQGGALTAEVVEKKVLVPDIYSFFSVQKTSGTIVRNKDGEPEQVLFVETSCAAKTPDLLKSLRVYLLPKKKAAKDTDAETAGWSSPEEVDEDVLKEALLLPVKMIPSEPENTTIHSFKVSLETDGQLFVTIAKGTRAMGGYLLGKDYSAIVPVPELPREIEIQGAGGVLALGGERKLSIKSRGVRRIEYEIARVPAEQINHLVSQTRGEFQNPEFVSYSFGRENISRISTELQSINVKSKFKANYSAFDFSKHLKPADDGGSAMQGLFFLRAREWRPPKKKPADHKENASADQSAGTDEPADATDGQGAEDDADSDDEDEDESNNRAADSRFILVTDLGIVVKENTDGSRDVFIASLKGGNPLAGVKIDVLGKNGVPLVGGQTDADGHLSVPSLGNPAREKRPVAFVARLGNDVAFMPFSREDRLLDYSRFDIGGVESRSGTDLDAFVFTERGIYRPGDEIRVGLIVKQRDWGGKLDGLPVETEVVDARGTSVQVRKLALPAGGFAETSYQTAYESPTGSYSISVYLVRDGQRGTLLGGTTVVVKEFLPDRMKIESRLSKDDGAGWVTPDDIHTAITLQNLYGTAATGRRIKAHLTLSPCEFEFSEYPGFSFFDPLRDTTKNPKFQEIDLGETKTDDHGQATYDLNLERFADATYALTLFVEGFEADGGRSVHTSNRLLVSGLPYVIGAKPDADFEYLKVNEPHTVEWIALDHSLKKTAVKDLEVRLIERVYVSVLTRKEDGDYVYESVPRENLIQTGKISISPEGLKYPIPTEVPGNYLLELRENEDGPRVSRLSFSVVGRGAVTRSLARNAELEVKLSRPEYNTGEDIEISIVAPYTGSGLISIERDKVYAYRWFKTDRTSSVQHIRVPADFEGTGYVNVCFVRALDSKEVFMSPLSFAAQPFKANLEKRRLPITLRAAAKARPGEPLHIGYKTDRPARIAIFAVDQGILQVTDYELPNPLAHFFRKAALLVQTRQIVDLILPEYSILRSASAFGGDGEKHLNPFKRVTDKPVVFWSGIVDAEPREREVIYDVPDYFSGTLTIMAVAMAPDAVGSTQMNSLIRGPFVLTPNVPTVAGPGDQFDVSLLVANGVPGSGPNAEVQLSAETSEHLEIVKAPARPFHVSEGQELSATFTVRAREKFGSATMVFHASTGGQESKIRSTLSVRPLVPFMTSVQSGNFTRDAAEVPIERQIHPDFRHLEATVSALPLGLARGLDAYLKDYPNGCSEQITSGAFCRLLLADEADFGLSRSEISAQLEHTFAVLRRRQNDQGSFGYWAADNADRIDFVSTYVMHFLVEAKAAGFAPPANVFQSGLRHLQSMVTQEPSRLEEARTQAYAIYLLTREGIVTTNYVLNLRDTLEHRYSAQWHSDLTAVYLAATCELLKKHDEAERLIRGYKLGVHTGATWSDFHSALGSDAQYVAIVARHFPALLNQISAEDFKSITRPIGSGYFNTLSAAYAVAALKAYSHHLAQSPPELSMIEMDAKRETFLRGEGSPLLRRSPFSANATALRFTARKLARGLGAFYQVVEAGYDTSLPTTTVKDGLEVYREFVEPNGVPTQTARQGEPMKVRLRIRSLGGLRTNVAIVDLLPGAFELAAGSLEPGVGSAGFDYVDVREDRIVFYGNVGDGIREVTYQLKPTNRGEFTVPPIFAESMYDRTVKARALAGKVTVVDAP